MKSTPVRTHLLPDLFASLAASRWRLLRTLRSDNPADINGELDGIATFTRLRSRRDAEDGLDMLYKEEGVMPSSIPGVSGLSWSKKYIWRLKVGGSGDMNADSTRVSVWFVKARRASRQDADGNAKAHDAEGKKQTEREWDEEEVDEADYLFHEFDFATGDDSSAIKLDGMIIEPPVPPPVTSLATELVYARGSHLCVKDMYRSVYAFRITEGTGEVMSWASRHVVNGPKKNQDIINRYERGH